MGWERADGEEISSPLRTDWLRLSLQDFAHSLRLLGHLASACDRQYLFVSACPHLFCECRPVYLSALNVIYEPEARPHQAGQLAVG